MKYAVEMCSGAMIYISSFIKVGSGIQKLRGGEYTGTNTLAYFRKVLADKKIGAKKYTYTIHGSQTSARLKCIEVKVKVKINMSLFN
jgi:hypothetical protein